MQTFTLDFGVLPLTLIFLHSQRHVQHVSLGMVVMTTSFFSAEHVLIMTPDLHHRCLWMVHRPTISQMWTKVAWVCS